MKMANRKPTTATLRLNQDYVRLKKDPVPYITAEPLPTNILEWHYVVRGPEATPYDGGYYHGKLVFPKEFPFKPPSIYMITPNGRFKTNTRLCLSISDYHPDTWNPSWSVSTIVTGLLSFMVRLASEMLPCQLLSGNNERSPTMGSIDTTDYDKRVLAYNSLEYNLNNKQFCELFPEDVANIKAELSKRAAMNSTVESQSQTPPAAESNNLQSILTNIIVLVGFAAFAFTVKFVMKSSYNPEE